MQLRETWKCLTDFEDALLSLKIPASWISFQRSRCQNQHLCIFNTINANKHLQKAVCVLHMYNSVPFAMVGNDFHKHWNV